MAMKREDWFKFGIMVFVIFPALLVAGMLGLIIGVWVDVFVMGWKIGRKLVYRVIE